MNVALVRIYLGLTTLCMLVPQPVHGQRVPSPSTAPPVFVVVSAVNVEDAAVVYMETRSLVVQVQGMPRVIVDLSNRQLMLREYKIWTAAGKELTVEEGLRRLKPGQTILLSPHGQKPDVAFRRVLKEDTLILGAPLPRE